MEINKSKLSTVDMIMTALMIALVYVAGSIIKVPSVGGFVHIGDCMVFLSVLVLGKKKGAFASATGMFLVDALGGYVIWAPFTFIIKGAMAYIAGAIMEKHEYKSVSDFFNIRTFLAFILAGIFMVVGYFASGTIIAAFLTDKVGIISGVAFAAKDVIGNIVQVVTGIILSIPLSVMVLGAKKKVISRV